jgi:hypothetical protein
MESQEGWIAVGAVERQPEEERWAGQSAVIGVYTSI